jgi:hypothetical protein
MANGQTIAKLRLTLPPGDGNCSIMICVRSRTTEPMLFIRNSWLLVMVLLPGVGVRAGQGTGVQALFADMGFERGFSLSYPDSSKGRSAEAVLNFGDANNVPAWRLCQWGTKHTLATARCVRDDEGSLSYGNDGKKVVFGRPDSASRGLTLEVRGSAEYGARPRKYGESWPHLLVEQDAVRLYLLDQLERIELRISLRLLYCTNAMARGQSDPGLHAAQFQMFLIIKNVKSASEDHGGYYWFGVPFFDSRYDVPPAYMAKDAGKDDATGKFIYTVDGKAFGVTALKPNQWLTIRTDLLPHIRSGLQEAVTRGYLKDSNPHDYAVANMNLGWEIPGTFDAAIQVRGLSLLAGVTTVSSTSSVPMAGNR